jgi:hypothetical protein
VASIDVLEEETAAAGARAVSSFVPLTLFSAFGKGWLAAVSGWAMGEQTACGERGWRGGIVCAGLGVRLLRETGELRV